MLKIKELQCESSGAELFFVHPVDLRQGCYSSEWMLIMLDFVLISLKVSLCYIVVNLWSFNPHWDCNTTETSDRSVTNLDFNVIILPDLPDSIQM